MTMPWPAEARKRPLKGNLNNLRALLSCEAVSDELPLVVDGSRRPSDAMAEHLRTCLRLPSRTRWLPALAEVVAEHGGRRRFRTCA